MTAATVMVSDDQGFILFLRRGPTDPWRPGHWDMPGGKVDPTEYPYEGAVRELYEEAGLKVSAKHLRFMLRYLYVPEWIYLYTVRLAKRPQVRLLDGEHDAYEWRPYTDPPRPLIPPLASIFQHPVGTRPRPGNGHIPKPKRKRST